MTRHDHIGPRRLSPPKTDQRLLVLTEEVKPLQKGLTPAIREAHTGVKPSTPGLFIREDLVKTE